MGALSPTHILILLVVVVLIFGASRVPKLGRSMGEGIRGFKEALDGSAQSSQPVAASAVTQMAASGSESPIVAPAADEDSADKESQPAAPAQ